MTQQRNLAVVGLSDEELAHLRLLLRHCASDLEHEWRLGDETGADLVIADLRSFPGQMARTRAMGSGVRCAVFTDAPGDDDGLVLARPLKRASLIALLNDAGGARAKPGNISGMSEDFYTGDDEAAAGAPAAVRDEVPALGLDEALRAQPRELRSTGPDAQPVPAQPVAVYAASAGAVGIVSGHDLVEYLDPRFLPMPARHELADAPPLTLDPKNGVAYAPAALAALEPYVRTRLRRGDWRPLTGGELAQVRTSQQAHPYLRLQWFCALLRAEGHLARHLDPGGTYRLKQWFEFDKGMKPYFRIATALMQPTRLHEVAAVAEAPMADVFSFITAAESVGLIEWTPRARRSDTPPPSLMDRLRRPFDRR